MAEIEVLETDITTLEVDAIANAANTMLRHGGGSLEQAARIEVEEVRRHLGGASGLARVVFAVRGSEAAAAFRTALAA